MYISDKQQLCMKMIDDLIDETTEPDNKYLKDAWDAADRWRNGEFSTTG